MNAVVIEQIDAEISRLQQAKALLLGGSVPARRGRKPSVLGIDGVPKRTMSEEGRQKIREAQRKRWADLAAKREEAEQSATDAAITKKRTTRKKASV